MPKLTTKTVPRSGPLMQPRPKSRMSLPLSAMIRSRRDLRRLCPGQTYQRKCHRKNSNADIEGRRSPDIDLANQDLAHRQCDENSHPENCKDAATFVWRSLSVQPAVCCNEEPRAAKASACTKK